MLGRGGSGEDVGRDFLSRRGGRGGGTGSKSKKTATMSYQSCTVYETFKSLEKR